MNKATGNVFLGGAGNAFLGMLLGPQSVFLLDHERHRLARHIISPTLTPQIAASYTECFARYVNEALDHASLQWFTRLGSWSRAVTMRAMCKIVLGIEDQKRADLFFRRFEATTGFLANFISYWKATWHPCGRFSIGALAAHIVRGVDEVVYQAIAERKREGATWETPLDALIRGQKTHGYDDGFIRDNLVALLAAGYDTTGSATTWMLYWIEQTNAYATLQSKRLLGDTAYLEAFRNEALRYCPPIEILPRKIEKDQMALAEAILSDLSLRDKNQDSPMVCPFAHRVHHDPAIYEDPNRFDPTRFINRTYKNSEYFPYGAGPRLCLGINIAPVLMDQVLEKLLSRKLRFVRSIAALSPVRRNVSIWPGIFLFSRLRPHQEVVA